MYYSAIRIDETSFSSVFNRLEIQISGVTQTVPGWVFSDFSRFSGYMPPPYLNQTATGSIRKFSIVSFNTSYESMLYSSIT